MTHITRVEPQELTDTDLKWLAIAAETSYTEDDPQAYLVSCLRGQDVFFRLDEGMLVVERMFKGQDREWYIRGFAGQGLAKKFKYIAREVVGEARRENVRRIRAMAAKKGMEVLFRNIGAEIAAISYVLEV